MNCKRNIWLILAASLLLLMAGCNSAIDDGGSGSVVFEALLIDSPPITGETDAVGACISIIIPDWSANMINSPKNALAVTSPFNDVILMDYTVTYDFHDGIQRIPTPRFFTTTGTILPNAEQALTFPIMSFDDFDFGMVGHTANVSILFHGKTGAGDDVYSVVGEVLNISCASGA
jgi:hypothetical protein